MQNLLEAIAYRVLLLDGIILLATAKEDKSMLELRKNFNIICLNKYVMQKGIIMRI